MCLFNIKSRNGHLEHFLSDKIYSITETNINDSPSKHIGEILNDWKDIHKNASHGLAVC